MRGSLNRIKFTKMEEHQMVKFWEECLKKGVECAQFPFGNELWKRFVNIGYSNGRTYSNLASHFRKIIMEKEKLFNLGFNQARLRQITRLYHGKKGDINFLRRMYKKYYKSEDKSNIRKISQTKEKSGDEEIDMESELGSQSEQEVETEVIEGENINQKKLPPVPIGEFSTSTEAFEASFLEEGEITEEEIIAQNEAKNVVVQETLSSIRILDNNIDTIANFQFKRQSKIEAVEEEDETVPITRYLD